MSRSVDFLATSSSSFASTSRLPPSTSILITDTLQSPSLFLATQLIARTLKPQDRKGKGKVILVGISEVESEYQAILKKQSVQLVTEKQQGNFQFIDGFEGDVVSIFSEISQSLSSPSTPPQSDQSQETLVILDDLSALNWIGNSPLKLIKFHLALKNLCHSSNATLVTVLHSDSLSPHPVTIDESDQYLFRSILQHSSYWFELKSLVSQSRGELSIHPAPGLMSVGGEKGRLRLRRGKEALEYRVEENGAVFEVKGLGRFI